MTIVQINTVTKLQAKKTEYCTSAKYSIFSRISYHLYFVYFSNIAVQTTITAAAADDDYEDEFYTIMISNIIISNDNREPVD